MSSSPSSSSQYVEGADGGNGGAGEFERPSSSRRRSGDGVWPDHVVEALASQVAIDASRSVGRLAAAPALFNIFQVCSTWRAVSRSELLWENLTRRIWNRNHLLHHTWRDEYIYRHRTARNFRLSRYIYTTLHFVPSANNNDGLSCRRLALSDHYLAAGFSDGTVRLFHIPTRLHFSTFHPYPRDRLGLFAPAVSGIILSDTQLIFASLDGDIHVATINNAAPLRRSQLGDVLNDGALVDFTGCNRWWVGLYAGVQGRSFHIWDGESEEIVFIGGSLTNTVALNGWRSLTEPTEFVGRVRVTSQETAVACTRLRVIVFDLRHQGIVLGEEEFRRRIIVGTFDASNEAFAVVNSRGVARVRRVFTLEQVCRFPVEVESMRGLLGCMNGVGVYALMCGQGFITAWDSEDGRRLYDFTERIGEANAMVADDRYVAASSTDGTIHLWDFGVQ
ncbi:hypothetical protein F0562_008182 [Nyssa sinensis]|uniref:F-box domain-containing protein n=1 Tax=Nyssa sinensis TaxID=561372 RepID=A0A5J5A689_9ASTE|nr:hypothetical protein F0562_008182 [Nyssa sinensis]